MLSIVPTRIGNLGDITLRAIRELQAADLVVAEDTRVSGNLLKHLEIAKPLVSFHAKSNDGRLEELLTLLRNGGHLALVTDAGTPGISDPGERLIRRAIAEGLEVQALPGPTAVIPALLLSGMPTAAFTFLGFLPHKKGRQTFIKRLAAIEHPTVFYESVHRIQRLFEEMMTLLPGDTPVAVCRELTKLHEETLRGTLAELAPRIAASNPRGEYVVVVGPRG